MGILSIVRVALVTMALVSAAPVAAQAPGMFTGDDDDFWDSDDPPFFCVELTDSRVRQRVADQGFSNIYLNARDDARVQVRATRGKWVYLLQVSTCTGTILYGQRLRPS